MLKEKGWRTILQANGTQKKLWTAILASEKQNRFLVKRGNEKEKDTMQ